MAKAKKKNLAEQESGFSELAKRFKEHPFIFTGTIILLVFIIIAFVFVPTLPSFQQDKEGLVFGYYNGKAITQNSYFNSVLQETASMMNFDLQGDYGINSTVAMQVWYQAFVRTFIHMATLDEMKKTGYVVPSREIDRLVASRPEFQEDGLFSSVKYNSIGKSRQQALWRNTEEEFITNKFLNDFMGLKISNAEKDFIGAMAYPERTFDLVSLPRSSYPDSELIAFAAANQGLFKNIHLSRITMNSEKEARQLLESIQNGKIAFEDAARNHSTDYDKDKGGDMGRLMAYEIFTEILEESDRDEVTSLRSGGISSLLKAPNDSWIFFRAEENPYTADMTQEDALYKVRSYMERFEGGRIENWLVSIIEEMTAASRQQDMLLSEYIASLQEQLNDESPIRLRALADATLNSVGPISLNYNNMGGTMSERGLQLFTNTLSSELHPELSGAASNEVFWRNAFLTPLNTPSSPFTLGYSIIVLTPTEENHGDDESILNIANFYQWGFMYNAIGADVNGAFMESSNFENNFYEVFMPILFSSFAALNDG